MRSSNGSGGAGSDEATGPKEEVVKLGKQSIEAAKHYPCIEKAWVEFLVEPPGAGDDRVDTITE